MNLRKYAKLSRIVLYRRLANKISQFYLMLLTIIRHSQLTKSSNAPENSIVAVVERKMSEQIESKQRKGVCPGLCVNMKLM